MPDDSKFYYPLQDEAAHLDRVFHDLVTMSNDEDDAYKERITDLGEDLFVKGVIDEDGYIHFIFDDVQSSRPIEVDEQEIPVGDGEDWVKPSTFYTATSTTTYEPTTGTFEINYSNSDYVSSFIIDQFQVNNGEEIINYIDEELLPNVLLISEYSFRTLTAEEITQIQSLFGNGAEFFGENKYTMYCGRSTTFDSYTRVTSGCFLRFEEVEPDQYVAIIECLNRTWDSSTSSNIVSKGTRSYTGKIRVPLSEGQQIDFSSNIPFNFTCSDGPKSINITNTDFSYLRETYNLAETRYIGSEFEFDDAYYPSQLVFGNDPRGKLGFANSCNITLRGKGKLFLDDQAYAHFMGNSFVKMEGDARFIGRNEGELTVDGGKFILGQTYSGTITPKSHIIDRDTYGATMIVDKTAWFALEQDARFKIDGSADLYMTGHAWIQMDKETRIDMDGTSRFFMRARNAAGDPGNTIFAENHNFSFQSYYGSTDNDLEENPLKFPNVIKKEAKNAFLSRTYPTLATMPSINAAKYVDTNTKLSTFLTDLNNSIAFLIVAYNGNLTLLNQALHNVFPDYNIGEYYILNDTGVQTIAQYLTNNPSIAEQVPDYLEREYKYLTAAEFNIVHGQPSSPGFSYSKITALQPMNAKQAYNFVSTIDTLNSIKINSFGTIQWIFNIKYAQYNGYTYLYSDPKGESTSFASSKIAYSLISSMSDQRLDGVQCGYYASGSTYNPITQSGGYTYNYNVANAAKVSQDYGEGTLFKVDGPNTSVIIGDSGRHNIRIGADTDAFINLDITSGRYSFTNLKFGANQNGQINYYITGDDLFVEYGQEAHIEVHDSANFILRGDSPAVADLGHRDEFWTTPYQNTSDEAPTLQLYHGSSLTMYGVMDDYYYTKTKDVNTFYIDISIDTLNNLIASENDYKAAAQYLLDYIYNGSQNPASRSATISILDKPTVLSIIDLYFKTETRAEGSYYYKVDDLKATNRAVIDFTATNETYSGITGVSDTTEKCKFDIKSVSYNATQNSCQFLFQVSNLLVGIIRDYRMTKIADSPLCEFAENAEFRMWGNTYLKIDDNGITIKDDSVNTAYTFTVADLKAAIEGGGGPAYPDAENIQV